MIKWSLIIKKKARIFSSAFTAKQKAVCLTVVGRVTFLILHGE